MCDSSPPCILVIFGGTGDLTHRKLIPALFNLKCQGLLPERYAIAAIGRRKKNDEEYRLDAYNSVGKYARYGAAEPLWNEFSAGLFYKELDFENEEGYHELELYLSELDDIYGTDGNRIFYLAVAPASVGTIIHNLHHSGIARAKKNSWQRIVIEKPFGSDLESARQLNRIVSEVFREDEIYRIDHYLGKEMIQSIMSLRFSNMLFEPLWNGKYIDHVQISSLETLGVENRWEYYDKAGALGDMMQNHMLQLLALLAMEPPVSPDTEAIRDEKVAVLKAVHFETAGENIVLGQYSGGVTDGIGIPGYRQENKVTAESGTETFVAVKLQIDNPRWQGVPFYIRTGKRLASKTTEVVVQFRPYPTYGGDGSQAGADSSEDKRAANCQTEPDLSDNSLAGKARAGFAQAFNGGEPNLLVIRIQPEEEVFIRFNTKRPGILEKMCPVKMSYCQKCKVCEARAKSPDAYEKLLYDVIHGDSTLFTRWDEVEKSWEVVEAFRKAKAMQNTGFPNYEPGSWGPKEADVLLERDGRRWWHL